MAELARGIVRRLRKIVGDDGLLSAASDLVAYECDGQFIQKHAPDAVVFPRTTDHVARIVKLCHQREIPFMPRGAGTGLSAGCLALGGGVMIVTTRMAEILEVNLRNRFAIVQPGVVQAKLNQELLGTGYYFAPDPAGQTAHTLGGNVAANAAGPHSLKYGVTASHVLGVEAVLADGCVVQIGGPAADGPGLDLVGAIAGSAGTLAVVTKAWLRLTRNPQGRRLLVAIFDSIDDAAHATDEVLAGRTLPAAVEWLDQGIAEAIEAAFHVGFPLDARVILLIEVDGIEAGLEEQCERVIAACRGHNVREVRRAADERERQRLWASRDRAFGAIGRLSPSYSTLDVFVPPTRLLQMLRQIERASETCGIRIVNMCHAGDGVVQPVMLFDARQPEQMARVAQARSLIVAECAACGGIAGGERGVGADSSRSVNAPFTEDDLAAMVRLRQAFNPENLLNANKLLPVSGA